MIYLLILLLIVLAVLFFIKPFWGLLVLVALVPFHAFLITYGAHLLDLDANSFLSYWKEFILAILFLRIIFDAIKTKKFPFKIIWADKLTLLLFVIALISILYGTKNLVQAGWGIRYDFEIFLVYFVVRALVRKTKQIKELFYVLLGSGFIVAIFGIIQVLFLEPDFLARCCGYSYIFNWTPDKPLQASQVIPGATPGSIGSYRIISTLAGPNQLGIYLTVVFLLSVSAFFVAKAKTEKAIYLILSLIYLVPIYFTYSRSAWLALVVGVVVIKLYFFGRKYINWLIGGIITLVLAGILVMIFGQDNRFVSEILLRFSSSGDHMARVKESLNTFIKHPFGLGIGRAGLVSVRFPENGTLINESWHLQILTELGFLGFLVYVGILIDYFREFWRGLKEKFGGLKQVYLISALAILAAVILHGFFLHTWTDISLVVIVWTIFGIAINIQQNELKDEEVK